MVRVTSSDDWSWLDAIQIAKPIFTNLGILNKNLLGFSML